ncbi:uncharacterized protein BDR25DRAFT_111690 [Lindgomyces ingoldianus]|uniref:Uncharacterized protein n=1 Tax=Lindgomyces ingoldianus TaxID=673940 RepID=A0ACB6R6F0_9PLEO|nr:uncharacterized protein BDR25DRAFT_111690 [Lindgomyces ingoldianus]KAF2474746.1 hypothetical protein BDR25DRAFT_111690 [Lindgomyces ingoldianus]
MAMSLWSVTPSISCFLFTLICWSLEICMQFSQNPYRLSILHVEAALVPHPKSSPKNPRCYPCVQSGIWASISREIFVRNVSSQRHSILKIPPCLLCRCCLSPPDVDDIKITSGYKAQ